VREFYQNRRARPALPRSPEETSADSRDARWRRVRSARARGPDHRAAHASGGPGRRAARQPQLDQQRDVEAHDAVIARAADRRDGIIDPDRPSR
jgi:hypothetical protein